MICNNNITYYFFTCFVTMVINSGEGIKPMFKPLCKQVQYCQMLHADGVVAQSLKPVKI